VSEYTAKDRVKAVFRRTFADRVPSYPILGAYTVNLTGASFRDYFTKARPLAEGQLAALDAYEPDVLVVMRDLLAEAEALGSEVRVPDRGFPFIVRHVLAEEPERLARLSLPDVRNAGRFPEYWEACRIVVEQAGDVPVGSILVGPWTIAANVRGVENLLRDTRRRPAFVRDFLELTTRVALDAGIAAREVGVGVSYSEPAASCSLISPSIYREFVQPVHRRLVTDLREKKIAVTFHVCGYIDPILNEVLDTGIAALSIDSATSLETAVNVNRGRAVLIGNVSVSAFETGTPADVEAEVRRAVDTAAGNGAFILASACEIPPTARRENVAHFARYAKEYGRYENLGIRAETPSSGR